MSTKTDIAAREFFTKRSDGMRLWRDIAFEFRMGMDYPGRIFQCGAAASTHDYIHPSSFCDDALDAAMRELAISPKQARRLRLAVEAAAV